MEIRDLEYFIAVAQEQNFTAASERLHVSQPAISKQIKTLEKELGKNLFIRGKRSTSLSDDGKYLYQKAIEILSILKSAKDSLQSDEELHGDISIGCGESREMLIIIKAMKIMRNKYPNIIFHLYSGNDEDVSYRLDNGLVDFGLFIGRTDLNKYDYLRLPTTNLWGIIMRKDDKLAKKEYIDIKTLIKLPLICPIQALTSREILSWLNKDHEQLNIISTVNLLYNAALMVESGMGYALTIDNLSNNPFLVFKKIRPERSVPLVFAYRKNAILSKQSAKFLEILMSYI